MQGIIDHAAGQSSLDDTVERVAIVFEQPLRATDGSPTYRKTRSSLSRRGNLLVSPSIPLRPEKGNDVNVRLIRTVVNQDALLLDQRLRGIAMPNHNRVVEDIDLQLGTRRQVKLVTDHFGNDDPTRTINGCLHSIMVTAMPLKGNVVFVTVAALPVEER